MHWYTVDVEFLDFLRSFEKRIPHIDYGVDKLKPFFGVLFEVGDLVYITQVSHPQLRHQKIKDNIDFFKLYRGNGLIGVVNLNYMFPVPKNKLIKIEYANISNFRTFESDSRKGNYIALLKSEMKEIKRLDIDVKAFELYKRKYAFSDDPVSKRCFEFKDLETKCKQYAK